MWNFIAEAGTSNSEYKENQSQQQQKKKQPWKTLMLTRGKTQLYTLESHPFFLSVFSLPYQLINRGKMYQFSPTAVVILQGPWRWKLFSLTSACHFHLFSQRTVLYCLSFQSKVSGWSRADMVFPLEFFTFTTGIEAVFQIINLHFKN